jgi:hypothetical protein
MSDKPNYALNYVLDCLRRAADNSQVWPVYPAESGALLAEFDRLRKENEELRQERPAVVAWLNRKATDDFCALRVREACCWEKAAEAFERGEHRPEEGA